MLNPNEWAEDLGYVNPVRNSSGASNPTGIIRGSKAGIKQRGIISNGVKSQPEGCGYVFFGISKEWA